MLDAKEIVEEYIEHYDCSKEEAIGMALEDLKLAQTELVRMQGEEQDTS